MQRPIGRKRSPPKDRGAPHPTPQNLQHSNRGGLRYRYYIWKSLARGRPRKDEQGKRWRIPAAEIENAVLVSVGSFLDDQSALSSILSLRPIAAGTNRQRP